MAGAGNIVHSLSDGTHRVRLGRSFTSLINSSNSCPTFHTFRYDFKPASIDLDKAGKVITGEREDDVSVNLPHVAESNYISTFFGGNQRPVDKECVLILDKQSGEMILELVSTTVNLKRIRDEPRPGVQIKPPAPTQTTPTPASGGVANNDIVEKPVPAQQPKGQPQTSTNNENTMSKSKSSQNIIESSNKKSAVILPPPQQSKKVGRFPEDSSNSSRYAPPVSSSLADVQNQLALSEDEEEGETPAILKPKGNSINTSKSTFSSTPVRVGSSVKESPTPGKAASGATGFSRHHHHTSQHSKHSAPSNSAAPNMSLSSPSSMSSSSFDGSADSDSGSDVEEGNISTQLTNSSRKEPNVIPNMSSNQPHQMGRSAPPPQPMKRSLPQANSSHPPKNFKGCGTFVDCDASSDEETMSRPPMKPTMPSIQAKEINGMHQRNVQPPSSSLSFSEDDDEEEEAGASRNVNGSAAHLSASAQHLLYQDLMLSEDDMDDDAEEVDE